MNASFTNVLVDEAMTVVKKVVFTMRSEDLLIAKSYHIKLISLCEKFNSLVILSSGLVQTSCTSSPVVVMASEVFSSFQELLPALREERALLKRDLTAV